MPAGIGVVPMNQSSIGEERMVGADRDQVATGGGAGQLDRRRRGVGTVLGELHHVGAGQQGQQRLGAASSSIGRRPGEVGAELDRCAHRSVDTGGKRGRA